jgi:two-component system OmpR family sensor kinase
MSQASSSRPARLRRWLATRTLRGRLIAGLLALLALACAGVGLASYLALQGSLLGSLDRQLELASERYQMCLGHPPVQGDSDHDDNRAPPPPGRETPVNCARQQAELTFSAQVAHREVSYPYVANGTCRLSAADKAALTAMPAAGHPVTEELSSLGTYRLVAVHGHEDTTYISGLPVAPVDTTLRNVEIVELVVFGVALLLTGVIGTGWVRLSLRPLRRVAATATRVTQLPLASGEVTLPERVPGADQRTEIGQVGTAFNRMLGHVESALARRAASEARLRRFAADASHELRTPLAAIRGYAELARRHPGPVPADIAHALSRVESESARMSELVDELLLLAQLDAGRPLASDAVDLTRLAIDASSDARAASPGHRWQLVLPDEPVLVKGDEHRLQQVMANLMSNAAKHTPAGTTVTVALAAEPGAVRLSVTDNGPGIPPELQGSLFERFVRGDSARYQRGGSTGLGLAIVDAVVTAHGGQVSVTSRPGHTRFDLTLPRLDAASGPAEGSPDTRAAQPPQAPDGPPGSLSRTAPGQGVPGSQNAGHGGRRRSS